MDPDGPDYEATPVRCRACEARETEAKKFTEDQGSTAGLLMSVTAMEG